MLFISSNLDNIFYDYNDGQVPALVLRITPNISEIWRTADKPIGTEMNRSIHSRLTAVETAPLEPRLLLS